MELLWAVHAASNKEDRPFCYRLSVLRCLAFFALASSACGVLGVGADLGSEPNENGESAGRPQSSDESESSDVSSTGSVEDETENSSDGGFVPTGGEPPSEDDCGVFCDIWDPIECGPGEKCVVSACQPLSNEDYAFRCRPVIGQGTVGDPCTNLGEVANSGFDDCGAGLVCYDVDPSTSLGTCLESCGGTPSEPDCGDGAGCLIYAAGWPVVCIPGCDPLLDECPEGQGCSIYPHASTFACQPASGDGQHPYATPCVSEECNPGLQCVPATLVPELSCVGASGCCTPYCDTGAPNDCPGEGQLCQPAASWLPPAYAHIGYCALPN